MKKKFPGELSISYNHDGVTLRVADVLSRVGFLELHITHEQFSRAIGNLAGRPVEVTFEGDPETLGKKKVIEQRKIVAPESLHHHDREELSRWLLANAQEPGWYINPYLGSQDSIRYTSDGETILNYSVFKYVTPTAQDLKDLED